MAHLSEDSSRLEIATIRLEHLQQLSELDITDRPGVYLFRLQMGGTDNAAASSEEEFRSIISFCSRLDENSIVCILTTPPIAAELLANLESILKFQLWVVVKLKQDSHSTPAGALPRRHAALLILSRYQGPLKHTKTRIQYTYCPTCNKNTKDYGGKKHVYNEYGTLISDVWRDIELDPNEDEGMSMVADRLADLFGLEPFKRLYLLDVHRCMNQARTAKSEPWKKYFKINEIQLQSNLINGDCLEILRTLPDNSLDFCFADPPYNLKKKYDRCNDSQKSIDYFSWCDLWLAELARILKPGRTLAVINIPLRSARYYQYLSSVLDFQCWIAWEALSFPVRMIMPAHYAILCFSKGQPLPLPGLSKKDIDNQEDLRPMAENFCGRASCVSRRKGSKINDREEASDLWHDIHRLKHNSRRADHPCQLPPKLMRRLFVLFTEPGDIIMDPFNGAGTSTLVAEQMGRRFIGIEISTQYHSIALMRHEMLRHGEDPFGKCNCVPKAKNSPVERLPKQKYRVTKKELQLDIKRICGQIGHIPEREEVKALGRYSMEYYDRYFHSWGEACAAARTTGMSELPPERKK